MWNPCLIGGIHGLLSLTDTPLGILPLPVVLVKVIGIPEPKNFSCHPGGHSSRVGFPIPNLHSLRQRHWKSPEPPRRNLWQKPWHPVWVKWLTAYEIIPISTGYQCVLSPYPKHLVYSPTFTPKTTQNVGAFAIHEERLGYCINLA